MQRYIFFVAINLACLNFTNLMKYQIGDTVALTTTGEEGKLVHIDYKKNMAEVLINGVCIPVHIDSIDHPYLNMFLQKKFVSKELPTKKHIDNVPVEKPSGKSTPILYENYGVHLVFVPIYNAHNFDLDNVEKVKVYLVNNTPEAFAFSYNFRNNNGETFSLQSDVHSQGNFYVHNIDYENLATGPYFEITGTQHLLIATEKLISFEQNFQLKPKKLFQYLQEMQMKNAALFGMPILKYEMPESHKQLLTLPQNQHEVKPQTIAKPLSNKAQQEAQIIEQKIEELKNIGLKKPVTPALSQPARKNTQLVTHFPDPYVVDLHLEKLVSKIADIPHDAKLGIQLNYFLKALENAIINHQDSLVVIHGLGKGVLKSEIHGILNQTKEVHSYVNEYSKKYGYGSTEIFFVPKA